MKERLPAAKPSVGLSWWVAADPAKMAAVEDDLPQRMFELDTSHGGIGALVCCCCLLSVAPPQPPPPPPPPPPVVGCGLEGWLER